MSEVPETGPVSVDDVLQAIQQKNVGQAKAHFQDLMADKVSQSLDAEKIKIANNVFNGASEEDQEEPEVDIESEIEDAIADILDVDAESN